MNRWVWWMLPLALLLSGCASEFTKIAPRPPANFERLGATSGKACGSIMIGPTAYNFIPVMLNDRVDRAYQRAVAGVPGATGLVDVEMSEDWLWWVGGSARCTTINGEAIR